MINYPEREISHPSAAACRTSDIPAPHIKDKVTIKDIAVQVGCAHSIVSNVLNNSGRRSRVSELKRQLILDTARQLGYRSNLNARRLVGKSTRMIGVLVSRNLSPISSDFIMALTHEFTKRRYNTLHTNCLSSADELRTINNFIDFGFDGIITTFLDKKITHSDIPLPAVLVGGNCGRSDLYTDFRYGEYLAVSHLIWHGHRKIAFFCDKVAGNPEKFEGYQAALQDHGIAGDPAWVYETEHNENWETRLHNLVRKQKVRAFAVTGDELAGRLMTYLQQHGLRIPEDIAITGCDANFSALLTSPALTSIVYPTGQLAMQTVELLTQRIKSRKIDPLFCPIGVKPKLFLGGSCGCPPFCVKDVCCPYPSSRTVDYYARESKQKFNKYFHFEE